MRAQVFTFVNIAAKRRRDIDPLLPGRLTHWRKILHHNQPWGYNTSCVLVLGHMITSFCGNGRPRYGWPGRQWHSLPALSRHSTHWSPPEKATSWQLLSLERQTLLLCDLVTWLLFSRCTVALGRAAKKTPSAIGLAL